MAARFEVPIIEDDFDSELYYDGDPPPPLKSLPGTEGVIYIATPSKMLFPGLRIGWIVAAPPVVERLGRIKQLADLGCPRVVLSGGEALMRPDWLELIDAGVGAGLKVGMITLVVYMLNKWRLLMQKLEAFPCKVPRHILLWNLVITLVELRHVLNHYYGQE